MTVTYPIIPLADGEVLSPSWISDATEAVNDLHDDVTDLTLLTTAQSASSFTASASIGTSATAVLTLTSCILGAGRAYSVENIGGVLADVEGRYADFALFKTSTAGTQIGAFYRTRSGGPGQQTNCYGKVYIRNSTAANLTFDLVLSMVANAGTVVHDASSINNRPRALVVSDVGPATGWSFAFAVT